MQISSIAIIAGVVLLALGLLRKVKKLIWIGIIVAVVAAIVTGGLGFAAGAALFV